MKTLKIDTKTNYNKFRNLLNLYYEKEKQINYFKWRS